MTSNDLMLSSVDLMRRCGVGGVVPEARVLVSEHDSWTSFALIYYVNLSIITRR
jgi:hypothetical protein